MRDMICTCTAEAVRAVEERRLRIFRRMGLDDMGELALAIVLSLGFDFQASCELSADMWFGVDLTTPLVEAGLYIECDAPADGLAALWEELAEKFPERVSVKQGTSPARVRVTERISAALLGHYEQAEMTYRDHVGSAHKRDVGAAPCEDCEVFMQLYITEHMTLDATWGDASLDASVARAYEWVG